MVVIAFICHREQALIEPALICPALVSPNQYAEVFGASVTAGTVEASQLTGYRRGPIFIRNSMHTPLPSDALLDSLETLWDLLETEPEASVRAVLGHHLFVFIHTSMATAVSVAS
jgi:hypothetical protein